MDLNLTEEQQMLRDGVRRFIGESYDFEARGALAAGDPGFSADHWKTFAELGWLALGLPEDVGGLGCSFVETAIIMEAFGAGLVLEPYATTAVLAARILNRAANRALRASVLPMLAEGRQRIALAHYEPTTRYELTRVETRARRTSSGYILNGEKAVVLDAPSADRLIVSARLEGHRGFGLFLLDRSAPGIGLRPYRLIDDTRAADVMLRDAPVSESALLADEAHSLEVLEDALDRLNLARVAEALGAMEAALDMTQQYVKSRVQFGQPLAKFQAVQHRLAEMFVEIQETRSILYCGLAHIEGPPAERGHAVSAARVVAAEAGRIVCGWAIQLHGGIGVTEEYRVGHYFKRLATLEKLFGDTDYHLARLARSAA